MKATSDIVQKELARVTTTPLLQIFNPNHVSEKPL